MAISLLHLPARVRVRGRLLRHRRKHRRIPQHPHRPPRLPELRLQQRRPQQARRRLMTARLLRPYLTAARLHLTLLIRRW